MPVIFRWTGALLLACGLAVVALSEAQAKIPAAFPLKGALDEHFIVVAKVEKLLPDKPAMMLKVDEVLKGKPAFTKMPVVLEGSDEAKKEKQVPQLLKRVAEGVPLVVFVSKKGKKYTGFGYTNGTWFQMLGTTDGDDLKWEFLNFEPVLRQTFKGTTQELKQACVDGLSGKKEPPEVDLKEKPGIGPELSK